MVPTSPDWGTNLPVSGVHINSAANVNYTPWMTMTVEALPASMSASGTSTSILYARYIGDGYQMPDGHLVFWDTNLGSLSPDVSATYQGVAVAELSSMEEGTALITVTDGCGQIITLTVQALGYKPRFDIYEHDNTVLANSAETFTVYEYVNEADTAVLAKVHEDGRVKVSLRSRGGTDVGGLAQEMGGGGHRLAAGFTVEGDVEEVLSKVFALVESYR